MITAAKLRNNGRKLDRLNNDVDRALRIMRKGAALHLRYNRGQPEWRLSSGEILTNRVAKSLITRRQVHSVGDGLFVGSPAQTWRYVEGLKERTHGHQED